MPKAPEVLNFKLTDDDTVVLEFLMQRTGITSGAQVVRMALREAAEARGRDGEDVADAS